MKTTEVGGQEKPLRTTRVDVIERLDLAAFGPQQKLIVLLACVAIIFDGFDGQLASFAIPLLVKEWGVARGAFATVVAAGLVGMALGSASAGYLGDRFGRRSSVVASVALFSVGTMCMALAHDIPSLAALRFIAGLGVGGALPTATTLAAEFTPRRFRTIAVTTTIIFVPVGGMLAGLFAAMILPQHGWKALFLIGGALPLAFSVILLLFLAESPHWLAQRSERWPRLRTLLNKIGHPMATTEEIAEQVSPAEQAKPSVSALFSKGLARSTTLLWLIFFMSLLAVYTAFSWLPTLLSAQGFSPAVSTGGLTAYNLGGAVGAVFCAVAIARFGSRWPMVIFTLAGAATAAILAFNVKALSPQALIIAIGVHGMAVIAVQCTLYALCAHIYPTSIRATGTASGLTFGRLGAILSAFVGAAVLATSGLAGAFWILAGAMTIAAIALFLIRDHIQPALKKAGSMPG